MGSGISSFFSWTTDADNDGTQIPDPGTGYVLHFAQPSAHRKSVTKPMAPTMKSPSAQQQRGVSINARVGAKPSVTSKPSSSLTTPRQQSTTPTKMTWITKEHKAQITLQDLEMGRVIGRGLMGTVRMARLKTARHQPSYVAIKKIEKSYIERHKDERHINYEREILMSLGGSHFCIKVSGKGYSRERARTSQGVSDFVSCCVVLDSSS